MVGSVSLTCAPEVAQFMQQFHFWLCLTADFGLKNPPEIQQVVSDRHMQMVYVTLSEGADRGKGFP